MKSFKMKKFWKLLKCDTHVKGANAGGDGAARRAQRGVATAFDG